MRSNPISVSIAHHLDLESYFRRLRNDQGIYIVYDTGDKEPELSLVSIDRGVFDVIGTMRDKGSRRNDFKISGIEQQSILAPSRIIELVKELLSESKVELNRIDDIVLSEDPSRTTEAQGVLESYFGKLALAPIGFPNDQAVVYGAAIQSYSIITDEPNYGGECGDLPVDITPLDLGIETSTGDFAKLISRHRMILVANSIIVSTAEDNQENVTIRILEGARETAFGNRELGTLNLTGLPHKPKGVLEIDVLFVIETNGVLYVSAGCKGRSKVEELVVGARKYTNDEIRSLVARVICLLKMMRSKAMKGQSQ